MKCLVLFNSGVLASTEFFSDFLFEGKKPRRRRCKSKENAKNQTSCKVGKG